MRIPALVLLLSLTCSGSALASDHAVATGTTACALYRDAAVLYRGTLDLRETELVETRRQLAAERVVSGAWRDIAAAPPVVVEAVPTWAWVAGAALVALTAVAVAGWVSAAVD